MDRDLEAALRASRRHPDPLWAAELEDRLVRASRRSGATARLGVGLVGALAMLALGLSLADTGPLGHGDPVSAEDRCTSARVTRTERVPVLIARGDARPEVRYRNQLVTRHERRC